MTEKQWVASIDPRKMVYFLIRERDSILPYWVAWFPLGRRRTDYRVTDRKLRLFNCACGRRAWAYLNEANRAYFLANELFADGGITLKQLHELLERALRTGFPVVLRPYQGQDMGLFQEYATYADFLLTINHQNGTESRAQSALLRDIIGNPFRPVTADPVWLTSTVVAIAEAIYSERAFERMPILGDALEDAGCDNAEILDHCRQPGEHARGCWVVDLVLGKK